MHLWSFRTKAKEIGLSLRIIENHENVIVVFFGSCALHLIHVLFHVISGYEHYLSKWQFIMIYCNLDYLEKWLLPLLAYIGSLCFPHVCRCWFYQGSVS